MYTPHSRTQKWEKAHATQTACLSNPWLFGRNTCSLTDHITKFRSVVMDITRCCKHTRRTPPTEQEQVLLLLGSILSTDPTLTAHIAMVTSNPNGLGMRFEDTATTLMSLSVKQHCWYIVIWSWPKRKDNLIEMRFNDQKFPMYERWIC